MIALPIAHDPFAEGAPPAPYLVPLPAGFDPFAQATPDAASTSAATPASPPPPPWILAPVHHDPFRGPPSAPYLVPLPLGYDPFAGSDVDVLNPSASSSPSPPNADTPMTDAMTPAYAMAPAIQDRRLAADAGGLRSTPATSVADAPWWLDQFREVAPADPDLSSQQPGALRNFGTAAANRQSPAQDKPPSIWARWLVSPITACSI
jgi:hypothetical protein